MPRANLREQEKKEMSNCNHRNRQEDIIVHNTEVKEGGGRSRGSQRVKWVMKCSKRM